MANADDAADQPETGAPRFAYSTMCDERQGANCTVKGP